MAQKTNIEEDLAQIAHLSTKIGQGKDQVPLLMERGSLYLKLGEWEKAQNDFSVVLESDASNPDIWISRAECRWELKAWQEMESDLAKALALNPSHTQGLWFTALNQFRKGDDSLALKNAQMASRLEKRHPGLMALQGYLNLEKNSFAEARSNFLSASQMNSSFPLAWWGLGQAYSGEGDALQAKYHQSIACAMDSKFCANSIDRALVLTSVRKAMNESYPGYCMCCRLIDQSNEHRETEIGQLLAERGKLQGQQNKAAVAFHDFGFEDRVFESGINFSNSVVVDSAKEWKPVHYDHGNGVAVADVDGDGLLDLYFTTQLGENQLWRNLGDGTFENITATAGVAMKNLISVAVAFADVDNDGDADLFVTTVRNGNVFFENQGNGVFKNITEQAGLGYVGHSSAPVFFDLDNDGLLDLFLANVGTYTNDDKQPEGNYVGIVDAFAGHLKPERHEKSLIYRNLGGLKFSNITEEIGFSEVGFIGDAVFVDLNQDGFQDLYLLNMQGDDRFYLNLKGKKLQEATSDYFLKTPWGSMGAKFFDYNNDTHPDLFITDMHSDMSANVLPDQEKEKSQITWSQQFLQDGSNNIFGNAFYKNSGEKPMVEISDALGAENYWPWGLSVGDLNADGFQDAFITSSMNYPFRYGVNTLLLNNQGTGFRDAEFLLGVEPRRQTVKPWFSVDCEGIDSKSDICKNRRGKQVVWGAYGSRSSVLFDLDGDGDLDIVTNEFNSHPQVLISNLSSKTTIHYLVIDLEGTASNREGLGAVVKVMADGKTYTQTHDGKSGYLAQSAMPLYFGLGKAKQVDRIEIQWPSGIIQKIKGPIPTNQTLKIEEKKD